MNGHILSEEEASAPVTESFLDEDLQKEDSSNFGIMAMRDTGGIPAIDHYNGTTYGKYSISAYSAIQFWDYESPKGKWAGKSNVNYDNPYLNRAIIAIDLFVSDLASLKAASMVTVGAITLAAMTWETVIGLIAAGGTAGAAAVTFITQYNGVNSDLESAVNYINMI